MNKDFVCIPDQNEVLERLAGNEELFIRMLRRFSEKYCFAGEQIHSLLNQERSGDLYIYIHSLKGIAASLGMQEIYETAKNLELLVKSDPQDNLASQLDALAILVEAASLELRTL